MIVERWTEPSFLGHSRHVLFIGDRLKFVGVSRLTAEPPLLAVAGELRLLRRKLGGWTLQHPGRFRAAVLAVERRSGPARWDGIGGQRHRSATSSIDRDQRSARSLVAFVSLCQRLAVRQTVSGFTTEATEQLRPHRQRSHRPR